MGEDGQITRPCVCILGPAGLVGSGQVSQQTDTPRLSMFLFCQIRICFTTSLSTRKHIQFLPVRTLFTTEQVFLDAFEANTVVYGI